MVYVTSALLVIQWFSEIETFAAKLDLNSQTIENNQIKTGINFNYKILGLCNERKINHEK